MEILLLVPGIFYEIWKDNGWKGLLFLIPWGAAFIIAVYLVLRNVV